MKKIKWLLPLAATVQIALLSSLAAAVDRDLQFTNACSPAKRTVTIGFGGDLLMHMPLQNQAMRSANGFLSLWPDLVPLFTDMDLTYLNLETPLSSHHSPSGFPAFNTSPQLATDLRRSGVDLVSTANNHALDKGARGLESTMANLTAAGLQYFGTRSIDKSGAWHAIASTQGLNLAFVACTYSTNGIPDKHQQVMPCFGKNETPSDSLLKLVQELSTQSHISAVIVTPHWGGEYQFNPHSSQKRLAQALVDAGALAIVGTHPHVIQPWEKLKASNGREALVVYSTGNLVTNRKESQIRTSVFVVLGISVNKKTAWVNGVRYVPLYQDRSQGLTVLPAELVQGKERSYVEGLTAQHFGTVNRLRLGESLLTNPHCH